MWSSSSINCYGCEVIVIPLTQMWVHSKWKIQFLELAVHLNNSGIAHQSTQQRRSWSRCYSMLTQLGLGFLILFGDTSLSQWLHNLSHSVATIWCHLCPHRVEHGATVHFGFVPEAPHGIYFPHGFWPFLNVLYDFIAILSADIDIVQIAAVHDLFWSSAQYLILQPRHRQICDMPQHHKF